MVPLNTFLIIFILFFGLIGAVRGWARETLVAFSMILSLFMFDLLSRVDQISTILQVLSPRVRLVVVAIYVTFFAMIGYVGPALYSSGRERRDRREKVAYVILGALTGAANGYLIVGTLLHHMHYNAYPLPWFISPPADPVAYDNLLRWLAPTLLDPWLGTLVGISFLIVLIVYV
ncbi:MAG: CvpA family protein [Thermoflexales bacterium]|nr:CvpA family protein [Thermoflexales bacterium]